MISCAGCSTLGGRLGGKSTSADKITYVRHRGRRWMKRLMEMVVEQLVNHVGVTNM